MLLDLLIFLVVIGAAVIIILKLPTKGQDRLLSRPYVCEKRKAGYRLNDTCLLLFTSRGDWTADVPVCFCKLLRINRGNWQI